MRTCYDRGDIPEVLTAARRRMSWRTWTTHRTGYRLWYDSTSGLRGLLLADGTIDCGRCGSNKRRSRLTRAKLGFAEEEALFLALVLPTKNARAAIAKQVREKGAFGWFIPIHDAFAVFSTVPMLSKARLPYSIEVPATDQEGAFERILDLWWPDTGRMSWPNWPSDSMSESVEDPPPAKEHGVLIGFTNRKLPEILAQAGIEFDESGPWIDIPKESFGPDLERVLRASNLKSQPGHVDLDLQAEIFGPECVHQEDTG